MRTAIFCALGLAAFAAAPAQAASSCALGHGVKHVVHLIFDNVHLHRDNPNVPSDLEQMPHLLNFLQNNGALLANHHTSLISHTAEDIVTALTGVYGEKFGFGVSNSFGYFDPTGAPKFSASFGYWTDSVDEGTAAAPKLVPLMVDQRGKTHPAPWVPFTRAGCDVGGFSTANIEFENVKSDVDNVFGPTSPEHNEAASQPTQAVADFEGIAIHCAKASPLCAASAHARPDALPDEPRGYDGFQALFGNKYVAPAINNGAGYVLDLDGHHVADSHGDDGFPGFNPTPSQSLGYVAQMLEAGVPIVYFYIADAHDNHNYPGAPIAQADGSFGPGEANYVYQLKQYDKAFGQFFARLAADGITPANTVFIVTSDENDHFAGSSAAATPAGCDGVNTPCVYPVGKKGEVDADLSLLYATEFNDATPFKVHSDDAPTVYLSGNPSQTSAPTRLLEQEAAKLNGYDPIVGADAPVMRALADQTEMALLHMLPADSARWPNFTLFGDPDYFLSASGKTTPLCAPANDAASCFTQSRDYVWNHGDFQRDIVVTWAGIVGPGVRKLGRVNHLFTDHTDLRPTLMAMTGLADDYAHDGRVVFEILKNNALPPSLRERGERLEELAAAYKMINAPTGPLAMTTLLRLSTPALAGGDAQYARLEERIARITKERNAIAGEMNTMLEAAAFHDAPIDEEYADRLIDRAFELLEDLR